MHRWHSAEEHLGGREEREAGMLVLVVVPAEERAQPSTGVEQTREETRICKGVCAELRNIYGAPTEQAGLAELDAFEAKYAQGFPAVASSWRSNWERMRPFFDFPADLRRLIYTTNAIESLSFQLREVTKAKGHFPSDEAAIKLLYLSPRNAERKWTMVPRFWNSALNQLVVYFPGRLPAYG